MRADTTYFAKLNFRQDRRLVGIRESDRMHHIYAIGKTGTGKTTMLESFILQDIVRSRGVAYLDPHGDSVEKIMSLIPEERKRDVVYVDLTDVSQPFRYNPLRRVSEEVRPLVCAGILTVLERLFEDSWGNRLEHVLRFCLLALLQTPSPSFADILPLLQDKGFRRKTLPYIKTPSVRSFWEKEFPKYQDYHLIPIYNKLGQFLAYPVVRRVLFENRQDIQLRNIMDEGKILLCNLSKGIIGEDASHLIGSLLITSLGLAAFSRANIPESHRRPFHILADEFQNFCQSNLPLMLSELRKFKVSMTLANQYTAQVPLPILHAVLGNVGTLISFRIGGKDAPFLVREMPQFDIDDFLSLPNYHIYVKLMIDGTPSSPFSATTLPITDLFI